MKKLRIVLLPAALILIGAGAAFATNAAKNSGNTIVPGYMKDSSTGLCVQERSDCSTSGTKLCTWKDASGVSHTLSEKINETTCGNELFEP